MTAYSQATKNIRQPVHAEDHEGCFTLCGRDIDGFALSSEVTADVTCKRCLASLARKDREFRRKSNESIRGAMDADAYVWTVKDEAARAIAREGGRR